MTKGLIGAQAVDGLRQSLGKQLCWKQVQAGTCGRAGQTIRQYTQSATAPSRQRRPVERDLVNTSQRQSCRNSHDARQRSTYNMTRSISSTSYQRQEHPAPSQSTTPSPSSVSANEVSHFSRLASSWWDPHGSSRLLHLMNPLRHDFIRTCLASSPPSPVFATNTTPSTNDTIQKYNYLDIGCGGGIFASSAARLPNTSSVTAIDPTPECIAVAQNHARRDPALQPPKLTYHNCAIESLPSSVQPVDIITIFEVIEHITNPSAFLTACIPHLKPGGWIVGSTIARSPLSYLTTKVIAEAPVIGVVPRGTHDWNQYINPSELRDWFATKGGGIGQGEGQVVEWGEFKVQGVIYVPMLGWKEVNGSEDYGNYFFGVQRLQ